MALQVRDKSNVVLSFSIVRFSCLSFSFSPCLFSSPIIFECLDIDCRISRLIFPCPKVFVYEIDVFVWVSNVGAVDIHTNESLNNNFMVNIYVTTNYKGDDLIISWNVYSFVCSAQQMQWRHNVKQKRVNVFLIQFVINWCKIDDERTVFICVYCVKVRWFESRHCIIVTHSKCASVW